MGRSPEDGQRLLFETDEDAAVDLFCRMNIDAWCRLKRVCAEVFAIYTPESCVDFTGLAATASRQFGGAYFYRDFRDDPPEVVVWRNGEIWIADIPPGRRGRSLIRRFQSELFVESNAKVSGTLWRQIDEFCNSPIGGEEFLLEQ